MALRVLLADESTTIKKVMQLALQDYGVEVKSVPVGLDVIPVAHTFKPDIIFTDVLLQKRSGYDVARDIKSDGVLSTVPVVLMWSGFMEFDEQKAKDSGAEQRLEKPFDADHLRALVKDLVPRLSSNVVSNYLTFPPLPEFEEEPALETPVAGLEADGVDVGAPLSQNIYEIPEVDENDQFETVPLNMSAPAATRPDESWSHKDLSSFIIPTEDLSTPQIASDGEFEEVTFTSTRANASKPLRSDTAAAPTPAPLGPLSATEEVRAEQILREESRAVLERVAWQILPDICERVVKEELNRLLKNIEA